ncbi:hypothetical protein SLOPH_2257 [Spraguea lophii 42_110]|uniref:RING-type domain-containing protein n=1 Tax=Spraguea lophii (strain 42_110) TaxID=1358809 RepID=S7WB35_SPRLO|nr:hypothetical protein SLOPH_2257 [Spraguea lophii 42_110]
MKLIHYYGIFHFFITSFFILLEYSNSKNLYSTLIAIVQKNGLHFLFGGFILYLMYVTYCYIIHVFVGELRSDEISSINDKCFFFLTDFLLIITIFSDELSVLNLLVICFLLGVKSINWIFNMRIYDSDDNLGVLQVISLVLSASAFLIAFCHTFIFSGMCILFSFEFFIVTMAAKKNLVLFLLNGMDEGDKKTICKFIVEIIFGTVRLVSYLCFFIVTAVKFRVPFNIFRELVNTIKNLGKSIKNLKAFREIKNFLDSCEDVMEGTCPICAEDMELGKKIICGHSFHVECLKRWAEQQQVCPLCRRSLFEDQKKIIINESSEILTGIEIDAITEF